MMTKTEVEKFLNQEVVLEALGHGKILVFYGVIQDCSPNGVLIDNGRQHAILAYDAIIRIRQKGDSK